MVIVGQTASGKSALAMKLAQQFDGEIIAADSRTVYKGMDIGTAKPTLDDQKMIPHHLLDVVAPDESFTVADFQMQALAAITDVASRGKVPVLVGGSGLYVDAVVYNFSFRAPSEDGLRRRFSTLSVGELQDLLVQEGLAMPKNRSNPRHLIRVLETHGEVPTREGLRPRTLIIGVVRDREELVERINERVEQMVNHGFVDEVKRLFAEYGAAAQALQAPGYKAFYKYLTGEISIDAAKQQFVHYDMQYAKRQKTWFKRNPDIHWISNMEEAVELVTTFLNK